MTTASFSFDLAVVLVVAAVTAVLARLAGGEAPDVLCQRIDYESPTPEAPSGPPPQGGAPCGLAKPVAPVPAPGP